VEPEVNLLDDAGDRGVEPEAQFLNDAGGREAEPEEAEPEVMVVDDVSDQSDVDFLKDDDDDREIEPEVKLVEEVDEHIVESDIDFLEDVFADRVESESISFLEDVGVNNFEHDFDFVEKVGDRCDDVGVDFVENGGNLESEVVLDLLNNGGDCDAESGGGFLEAVGDLPGRDFDFLGDVDGSTILGEDIDFVVVTDDVFMYFRLGDDDGCESCIPGMSRLRSVDRSRGSDLGRIILSSSSLTLIPPPKVSSS